MAQLELAVLGLPRVWATGQAVKFATRKAQALLIFLAVEQVPIARDKLIDLLWTDSDLARGQMSLRKTLAHLRQGLNARVLASPDAPAATPLILAETGTLAINPAGDWHVDVQLLDKAYSLSRSFKVGAVALPELRRILEQAATAYTGDFLEGFSSGDAPYFDDWITVQREKWHTRFSAVLDRLSQLQFEGGEFATGIETAHRWVGHDTLNETAHRRLMQLHLAAGNRAHALQAYEACEAILARELNARPSPETEALADLLRTQTLSTTPIAAVPEAERPRVPATMLIGRVEEHRQLVQAYRLAHTGQPQGLVIEGEPGIGKTRLVQEFLQWAASQGAVVMQAAAYELTVNLPYQVWTDAFRAQLNQPKGRAALAALDRPWQDLLAYLLPELVSADLSESPEGTNRSIEVAALQNPHQMFEAAFRWIQQHAQTATASRRATESPQILFLDDVQWADAASLDLLHYLVHRCAEVQLPILLVMTLRTESAETFQPSLTLLRRHVQVKTVSLKALSQADSRQVVKALVAQAFKGGMHRDEADTQPIERFAQALFDETAGHPLYLLETFKSLAEERLSNGDSGSGEADEGHGETAVDRTLTHWQQTLEGWLAPGVKEVIQGRLRRLSAPAMTLLHVVAVLGQQNAFEAYRQTANLSEDDALNLLDEAMRRGLLRESGGGMIAFTHDKIREVVYAGISATRRRSLHRRSAETLEQLYLQRLDDHALLIAQHFDASDDPRALRYYQRAGDAAAKVHAYREAVAHYARAIELAVAEECSMNDQERRAALRAAIAELHFKQASMQVYMGQYGASVHIIRHLGTLAGQWKDAALEHVTRVWIAPNLALQGPHMQLDEAEQLANQVLPIARAAGSLHDEVQALRALMRVAMWRAQFDLARQYGQDILARVDVNEWPNEPLHGFVHSDLTFIESQRHDFEAAQHHQAETSRRWRVLDRPGLLVASLTQACFIATCRGQYEAAVSLSQEALDISRRIDNDWALMLSQACAGAAYFELGQADRAMAVLQEAIRLSRLHHQNLTTIGASAELARIYGKSGRVREGWDVAHAAYEVAATRALEWRPYLIPVLVELLIQQAQLPQAETWLAQGRALLNAREPWPTAQLCLDAAEAELALARCNATHALALSVTCVAACRQQDWRQQLPLMLLLQARALSAQGRLDEAMHVLREANDEATATHAQWSAEQISNEQRAIERAGASNEVKAHSPRTDS